MTQSSIFAPPFSLTDGSGEQVSFAADGPAIVCFIKEDCPTCREVMPVLAAFHKAFSDMMEDLVRENLLLFDWDAQEATITDTGREYLESD